MATILKLVNGGEDFFKQLEKLIKGCKKELHFQTYRIEPDDTGKSIAKILMAAAERGVAVYLFLDAYGSKNIPKEMLTEWEVSGIHVRFFAPILSLKGLHLGRRLHHKVVVADGETALIGGINVADKYRGTKEEPAWLDFAVWLEGNVCKVATDLCISLWGRKFSPRRWLKRSPKVSAAKKPPVQISHNDWLLRKSEIQQGYLREARGAQSHITLVASYFMPGHSFRKALIQAASRGVKVKVILAGESDVSAMKFGTTWLYDLLFRHNIEIHEWCDSILHGKAMSVDGKWCTIGSFNLMHLSTYGSVETNVEVRDKEFVATFDKRLEEIKSTCEVVSKEAYLKKKYWLWQFRNWLSYQFVRRVFYLMTFFSYKRVGSKFLTSE